MHCVSRNRRSWSSLGFFLETITHNHWETHTRVSNTMSFDGGPALIRAIPGHSEIRGFTWSWDLPFLEVRIWVSGCSSGQTIVLGHQGNH